MALGYDDQTSFMPYQPDELMQLEGMLGSLGGAPPPAEAPPMAMPSVDPTPPQPVQAAPTAPAPVAAPPPTPAIPPRPEPLPLAAPANPPRPGGLPLAGVGVSGLPEAERQQVMGGYQTLADQQMTNAEQAGETEGGILQNRMGRAQRKAEDATVEQNKLQMALAGKQAAREKLEAEGAEWSKLKENPAQAFEGREWAQAIAAIGIAAGTFSQAMGWQNGNPLLDQFNRTVDRSIAAQREQKNSRLHEIAARVGDLQTAEQLIGAQLHDAIASRAAAEQERADSQEAFDRLGTLVQAERQKSQEMLLGAYERLAPKEERQYSRPAATQGKTAVEQLGDLLRVRQQLEEGGYTPENPVMAAVQQQIDALSPKGQSKQEYDRAQDALKNEQGGKPSEESLRYAGAYDAVGQFAEKAGLRRDPKTGEWSAPEGVDMGAGAGETLGGLFGRPTPVNDALDIAAEAYGRARSGGVISKDEEERFKSQLGASTSTRAQLASKLNTLERSIQGQLPADRRKSQRSAPQNWK